jgi:AmmeMemoRadiSam system protein B
VDVRGPTRDGGSSGARRRAANAGSFYPADPAALARQVDGLIAAGRRLVAASAAGVATSADRPDSVLGAPPLGALVPHAGLMYSGTVAAAGWVALGPDVDTVLIAGTNHYAWFEGVGVWAGGAWETPLGDVDIDETWRDALLGLGEPFVGTAEPHAAEHSIEVQLPLLARVLPRARIAPFAVSLGNGDACVAAGRRVGRLLGAAVESGERVALVASSDLVHYPADDLAREVDARVLEPILALDAAGAFGREMEIRARRLPNVACGMCGVDPVTFALAALREAGARRASLLVHATSADVPAGDAARVVGYAAVLFQP